MMKAAMQKMGLKGGERIESRMVSRSIERAQKNVEARNFDIRKNLLDYDKVRNEQRKVIYSMRQQILGGEEVRDRVLSMVRKCVADATARFFPPREDPNVEGLALWFSQLVGVPVAPGDIPSRDRETAEEFLNQRVEERYKQREQEIGERSMRELERLILLDRIDDKWKDLLYNIDQLRDVIGLRSYAQSDPKLEYKREATELFQITLENITEDVSHLVFRVAPRGLETDRMANRWRATEFQKDEFAAFSASAAADQAADASGEGAEKPKPFVGGPKVGRNQLCPCGSGRKYKKCCGAKA
jgi:preprotein translocase subunit SecA